MNPARLRSDDSHARIQEGTAPAERENCEPLTGQARIPAWLIAISIVACIVAGAGLAAHLIRSGSPLPAESQQLEPTDPLALGKRVYLQSCAACHQPSGLGIPGLFPPLAGSEWVTGSATHGDNHLVQILLHGIQGPLVVSGKPFNSAMPPWNNLTDEKIAAVLTYIRSDWGNSAPGISPGFVKDLRAQSGQRAIPWSQKELLSMPPQNAPTAPQNAVTAPDALASP